MTTTKKWFSLCALLVACGGGVPATSAAPSASTAAVTPTATAAPTPPPPLVVIAMKLTGQEMYKGAVDVKEDGSVLGPDGKTVAKFVGAELQDKDGKTMISVAPDGTMKLAGAKQTPKFDDKGDLVLEDGAKFRVADDGSVMLINADGKADKTSGKMKIVGFKPQGRRAAIVLVLGMLMPTNASSAQVSATANPSAPPPKK